MRKLIVGLGLLLSVAACAPAHAASDVSRKIVFCTATTEVVVAAEEAKRAGLPVDQAVELVAEAVAEAQVDERLGSLFIGLTVGVYAGTQTSERYLAQCLRWATQ